MKFSKNTLTKTITISCLALSLLAGCKKDFFDLNDPSGIGPDIWNDEGAITLLLDKGYDLMMPQWPGNSSTNIHNSSDELNSVNTTFLYGQLTENSVTDIGNANNNLAANRYHDVRRCNLAIDGINSGNLPEAAKNKLKGQFFFLRGMVYYNMVRLYGGVPLIFHAQEYDGEESLDVPRSKSSVCFDAIARDLDSAAAYLPPTWPATDKGRVTKGAALALKGRALLNWASPQFNPNNLSDRWERAYQACKQAYDTCTSNGYVLHSAYDKIFTDETNKEAIIIRQHDAISLSPGRGTNTEYVTRPRSETANTAGGGQNQPTWNLVKAYTMNNGLPITNPTSNYAGDSLFWLNRDPRFAASISYNGDVWPLSGKAGRKQWNYQGVTDEGSGLTQTGFYTKRITNPTLLPAQSLYNSNSGGGSGMDWIELRFAEVIMNYAEAANETGRMTEAKDMVRRIRQRAGIVAGSLDYGLSVATNVGEMRDLILNERMVEFAMEGKRYWDLRRTRRLHLLTGTVRQAYRWTPKAPFTVATLESFYPTGQSVLKVRDTITINNINTYRNIFLPSLVSIDATQPINIPTTYYFYALPSTFRNSSFVIEQTIGWPGGTFDPLL